MDSHLPDSLCHCHGVTCEGEDMEDNMKMCRLGGDGIGYDGRYVDANEGNACGHGISICQYAMAGEHDDSLKCPVNVKFIMELVNQAEEKNKELRVCRMA